MMEFTLDLLLYNLRSPGEQRQSPPAAVYTALPPRKAGRGRSLDRLILYLAIRGNAQLEPKEQNELLERMARLYYKTNGSVTYATRCLTEELNKIFVDRNLRSAPQGLRMIGWLAVIVMRPGSLYLAQCGQLHAFFTGEKGSQHLYETGESERGLGQSRTVIVRYQQFEPRPRDFLILTPNPPPSWTPATLQAAYGQSIGKISRTLTAAEALIIQAWQGDGKIQLVQSSVQPSGDKARPIAAEQRTANLSASSLQDARATTKPPAPAFQTSKSADEHLSSARQPVRPDRPTPSLLKAHSARQSFERLLDSFRLSARTAINKFRRKMPKAGLPLSERISQEGGQTTIPPSAMALIAVIVPIIVVIITSLVYLQSGRTTLYQSYYQQAYNLAAQSVQETDPTRQQQLWLEALELLDKAEEYQPSDEINKLRNGIQAQLDAQQGIQRLNFQPLIRGGLPNAIEIRRIIATNEEMFLLNATNGNVLRAVRTSAGYEIDNTFRCGPDENIGLLIDIAPLQMSTISTTQENRYNAVLVGMDSHGNMVFCSLDEPPLYRPLPAPEMNWGTPKAIALEKSDLYVLDTKANAVWVFSPEVSDENKSDDEEDRAPITYRLPPAFYFSNEVPAIRNALTILVHQDDMFILHMDGHVTHCTSSPLEEVPTRCEDPAMFTLMNAEQKKAPKIEGVYFSQLIYAPPPDPSIYMLDPDTPAIYHFSLKLTLQAIYHPRQNNLFSGPINAFTLAPDRRTFLIALSDNIYSAVLP